MFDFQEQTKNQKLYKMKVTSNESYIKWKLYKMKVIKNENF